MILDIFLNLDKHLVAWGAVLGPSLYVILFLVIFCETGLVVTPFLPGDSLLFAVGALVGLDGSQFNIILMAVILTAAAIIGDNVNYSFGKWLGPAVFKDRQSRFLKTEYLMKAEQFYARHGRKAQILARFAPIFRTFVPFVAGMARMPRGRFVLNSVVGGILWINIFLGAGYFFGNIPEVKRNFHIVIFAVILISLMPIFIEWWKHRKKGSAHG